MAAQPQPQVKTQIDEIRRDVQRNGESFASCGTLRVLCPDEGTFSRQLDRIADIAQYEGWSFAFQKDGSVRFAKLTGDSTEWIPSAFRADG